MSLHHGTMGPLRAITQVLSPWHTSGGHTIDRPQDVRFKEHIPQVYYRKVKLECGHVVAQTHSRHAKLSAKCHCHICVWDQYLKKLDEHDE